MSGMNKNEFRKLVQKYLDGVATADETLAIEQYYQVFQDEADATDLMDDEEVSSLEARLKDNISNRLRTPEKPAVHIFSTWYFRAAAIFIVLAGVASTFFLSRNHKDKKSTTVAQAVSAERKSPNRFVTLPDGSTVVLHGKSSLTYGKEFNKTTREVTLVGEAYFDVVHLGPGQNKKSDVPFIISTGNVKTTVLGTAFNIKAWQDQKEVVITVTRGKVRVENERKLLAILTENKQVVFNTATLHSGEKMVRANETVAWAQTDMTFDALPFGELAARLEKRYDVSISFKNPALRQCTITGRFSGTETIEEVFRILSTTSNTTFSINGRDLVIDGEKCH